MSAARSSASVQMLITGVFFPDLVKQVLQSTALSGGGPNKRLRSVEKHAECQNRASRQLHWILRLSGTGRTPAPKRFVHLRTLLCAVEQVDTECSQIEMKLSLRTGSPEAATTMTYDEPQMLTTRLIEAARCHGANKRHKRSENCRTATCSTAEGRPGRLLSNPS